MSRLYHLLFGLDSLVSSRILTVLGGVECAVACTHLSPRRACEQGGGGPRRRRCHPGAALAAALSSQLCKHAPAMHVKTQWWQAWDKIGGDAGQGGAPQGLTCSWPSARAAHTYSWPSARAAYHNRCCATAIASTAPSQPVTSKHT
jgi:hypothetical protein